MLKVGFRLKQATRKAEQCLLYLARWIALVIGLQWACVAFRGAFNVSSDVVQRVSPGLLFVSAGKVRLIDAKPNVNPMRTFPADHLFKVTLFTPQSLLTWTPSHSRTSRMISYSHPLTLTVLCVCERGNCASAPRLTAWLHRVEEGACQQCSPTPPQKTAAGTARYTLTMYQKRKTGCAGLFMNNNTRFWDSSPFWAHKKHNFRLICLRMPTQSDPHQIQITWPPQFPCDKLFVTITIYLSTRKWICLLSITAW